MSSISSTLLETTPMSRGCTSASAALTMGTVEPISLEEEQRGRHSAGILLLKEH